MISPIPPVGDLGSSAPSGSDGVEALRLSLCRSAALLLRLGSNFLVSNVELFSVGLIRRARRISTGKSATPIMRLPMVPSRADAPPEIGSQGPSSESYSLGRYLWFISTNAALMEREEDYNLRVLKSSRPSSPNVAAANALSRMLVRFTRQTAARLGASAHRRESIPSMS